MAAVLAYLMPPGIRHEPATRAGLALIADSIVNLRSCGQYARAKMGAAGNDDVERLS